MRFLQCLMYLPHRIRRLDDAERAVFNYSMAQDAQDSNSKGTPDSTQVSTLDHSLWILAKVLWDIAKENENRAEISVPSIQKQPRHQSNEEQWR